MASPASGQRSVRKRCHLSGAGASASYVTGTATLLPDGRVLIVGSLNGNEDVVAMAEIREPVEE